MVVLTPPQNSAAVAPVVEAVFLELKVIPPPDMLGVPGVPELVVTKTIMTSEVDALIVLEQVTVAVAVAVAVPLQEAPSVGGVWANATWTPGSDARAPMTITKTSASAFLRITPLAPLALLPGSVPSRASATSRRITIRLAAKGHCRYLFFSLYIIILAHVCVFVQYPFTRQPDPSLRPRSPGGTPERLPGWRMP